MDWLVGWLVYGCKSTHCKAMLKCYFNENCFRFPKAGWGSSVIHMWSHIHTRHSSHVITHTYSPLITCDHTYIRPRSDYMWWVASMYVWSHVMSDEYVCVITCDEWRECMCDHMWWSVFCFLVDGPTSWILNYIHQIKSERQRCPDVAFIGISK
jgi:hypothetical protein